MNDIYNKILGRNITAIESLVHRRNRRSTLDIEQILLNSDEYKLKFSNTLTFKKQNALDNLLELKDLFNSYNVKFWLDSGTLLGYYRDKDFISHDHDVDIGVNFSNFDPKIIKDLYDNNWDIYVTGLSYESLYVKLNKRNISTDIFFYYPTNNNVKYSVFSDSKTEINKLIRLDFVFNKFNLKEIEFLGHNFYAPENELEWLMTVYGNSWNIPNKNWNWQDSLNIHYTNLVLDRNIEKEQFIEWAGYIPLKQWNI